LQNGAEADVRGWWDADITGMRIQVAKKERSDCTTKSHNGNETKDVRI